MTKQKQHNITCTNCGTEIEDSTPFSQWLRQFTGDHPLSSKHVTAQNLDYIWFHYRPGWFITIEEKRFGAVPDKSQSDVHGIISQMLSYASGMECDTMRGKRSIYYRGHFVMSFEQTTPEDSKWVSINGTKHINPKVAVENILKNGNVSGVVMAQPKPKAISDEQGKAWLKSLPLTKLHRLAKWCAGEVSRLLDIQERRAA